MRLKIKDIILDNNLILAPMAGVSNSPFRLICREMGAGLVVAEMVSDKGLFYNNQKTKDILYINPLEKPVSQQIFGSDLKTMVEAAIYIDKYVDCSIIDINMGCPVPKVALKNQAGSALMKNPKLVYEIVSSIVKNVSKPVSVKIRSGWDDKSINAVEIAKEIERAGALMITVHARTRAQGYSGKANLEIIKAVKENVNIPVIGNGDITNGYEAKKMLEETGCDGIMIGRGALGNPWIFKEINHFLKTGEILERPTPLEIKKVMLRHLNDLALLKGEKLAVL
ncbi:tRNA dihydrouridine synthase DusB, partial [Acholeplasma sp. OttesenSCG-928-E16]|nr:tRNA dihydrouridine synthase DusB [Acholeplasma sp. OttesenSCG-928-E16]